MLALCTGKSRVQKLILKSLCAYACAAREQEDAERQRQLQIAREKHRAINPKLADVSVCSAPPAEPLTQANLLRMSPRRFTSCEAATVHPVQRPAASLRTTFDNSGRTDATWRADGQSLLPNEDARRRDLRFVIEIRESL